MTKKQKTVAKILELKGFTKEQLEAEVRKANIKLRDEEERLIELDQEFQDRSDELARKQDSGEVAVHEMDLYCNFFKHLGKLIEQQQAIVAIRSHELDGLQQAMVAAYREQRLLEKLQDKIRNEQIRGAGQIEQKQADYQFLTRKGLK
ncbi:MAG TPA: flagellar FliJ family protein [Nitrospirota bacterium]|nr:flagellar FliJ family protein [Nitrospirota bacterium]